jgi:hypothetical protein
MKARSPWRFVMWLIIPACLFLAGCVTKSASDSGTTVRYEWWVPVGVFAAGIVVVPLGLVLRRVTERYAWVLIIGGPLAALVLAPNLLLERTHVDDQGFEVHSGFMGMTAEQKVKFDDVKSIRLTNEETGGRHSREIEVLFFEMKSGPTVKLPLNNDVKIEAGLEIAMRAKARGIALVEGN